MLPALLQEQGWVLTCDMQHHHNLRLPQHWRRELTHISGDSSYELTKGALNLMEKLLPSILHF